MGKCIIVGGNLLDIRKFSYNKDDYIIASDLGYKYLKDNNIKPNLVVGDFDTLKYIPEDETVIKLNPIKDITDTHACIEEGIKHGYSEFEIYGCLKGRLEHEIALIQNAFNYKKKGYDITMFSKKQTLFFILNEEVQLEKKDGFISIFSYVKESKGVSIKGLKYEVNNITLTNDFPLGVSNEFINKKATIKVDDGCLLIVI